MPTHDKNEDYFIPVLAPYVQWVKAYRELLSSLYKEHKTVRKAWKAFTEAIPGLEGKLEFAIFEQILLFSLFLSEWNDSEISDGPDYQEGPTKRLGACGAGYPGDKLDTVVQNLRDAFAERDRALWNLKHAEQTCLILKDQKSDLEAQAARLEMELDKANGRLEQVRQQFDNGSSQNAALREQIAALMEKEVSLERQIARLRKRIERLSAKGQTPQIVAVQGPADGDGFSQSVIQWLGPGVKSRVIPEVIQNSERQVSPKKVGRWNAQRSKDGYYRLYRKIAGRVHSIYVGKELDIDKAQRRIADKESKLFVSDPVTGGTGSAYSKRQMKMQAPLRSVDN